MTDPEHIEINSKLDNILKILNGNGKIGFIAKCQMVYDWMLQVKDDKHSMGKLIYNTVVFILIGFIAVKLGLK